jgi:hypothetical protein
MKRERRQPLRRTFSPDSLLDEFTHGTVMALPQKKKQVTFHEDVVVVPISLRSDYSHSLRAKVWTNIVERCDNEGKRSMYLHIQLSFNLYFSTNLFVFIPLISLFTSLPPQNGI